LARLEEASARVARLHPSDSSAIQGVPQAAESQTNGVAVAARALRVRGDVRLGGPVTIVVPEPKMGYAAGRSRSVLVSMLRDRRPGWPVTEVGDADGARVAASTDGGTLVVVEGRPDPLHGAVVAAVLETDPDAVVVYGGLPTPDDRGERTVHTHGTGAATATAVIDLLLGEAG
jgi:hypothetical protein